MAAHEHRDAGEARPGPAYTPCEGLQPGPDNVVERETAQPERWQDRRDLRAAAYGDIREAVGTNRRALHQRERPVRPQRRATALERRPFLRRELGDTAVQLNVGRASRHGAIVQRGPLAVAAAQARDGVCSEPFYDAVGSRDSNPICRHASLS